MENPRIVPDAWCFPGECMFTGGSDGPFIDTGQDFVHEGRAFVSVRIARELGRIAGLVDEDFVAEVVGAREETEKTVAMQAAQIEELTERLAKLEKLRKCIAFTLRFGLVDSGPRAGKLRAPPKMTTSDIDYLVAEDGDD